MRKQSYLLITAVFTTILMVIFFGPILKNPNQVYFAPGGDGLKAYYSASYHLKYDKEAFRTKAMNYPYGENVFFTDSQPLVVNSVKFFSEHFFNINDHIVGIINLLMMLSVLLGAVFLYLIFHELKVDNWFAVLAAIGITFLSPQIGRLGGHFTLAYLLWLPLMIWLLIKFDKKRTFLFSGVIGLITFLATGMHMYFFALFGLLFLFYWGRILLRKEMPLKNWHWLLHVTLQFVLPFLLIQTMISLTDSIGDRTTHPWGFFTYRANPASVLLPLHKPYTPFFDNIKYFQSFDWEAYAFIGMPALIGLVWGIARLVLRIRRKQPWYQISESPLINTFFWASFVSLLLSFSIPFNMGLKFLLDHMGPIQQLRALSRFSWLFYYMLNIVVFYGLFRIMKQSNVLKVLTGLAFAFLFYDAWINTNLYAPKLVNRIPELEDKSNTSAENAWFKAIDPTQFQAVLPLPYFHVGSENVWLDPKCDVAKQSYIVSLKTGLPNMAVMLSRTSLSQTYKSLELISSPVAPYRILSDMRDTKPLLLVVDPCGELNPNEKNLLNHSEKIWEGQKFAFYKLELQTIKDLALKGKQEFDQEMNLIHTAQLDSAGCLTYESFDKVIYKKAMFGKGAIWGSGRIWKKIFDKQLKDIVPGQKYELLFWVRNYETDLIARSVFEFVQKNGDKVTNYQMEQFQHYFCSLSGDWMRIKIPFEAKSVNEKIILSIRNPELKGSPLICDELIIRKQKN